MGLADLKVPLKLAWIVTRRIYIASELNGAYVLPPINNNSLIPSKWTLFTLFFSGCADQSHNFTNLIFVTSSLSFSIVDLLCL